MPNTLERRTQLDLIRKLDEMIGAHSHWMARFNRALISGSEPEPGIAAADAYRQCGFGRWYHALDFSCCPPWLSLLKQAGALHQQMHAIAGQLVERRSASSISVSDYDLFTDSAHRFKALLRAVQFRAIEDLCLVDHLTGVWNRGSMPHRLHEEYDRMLRHGGSCCLAMMDLDRFKEINDRYGHVAGDCILNAVAGVALRRLRRYDSVFRYGGEEFLFCLPRISLPEAVAVMERIRMDLSAGPIQVREGREVTITASFGVAEFSIARSINENIEAADNALLAAKAMGRNQVFAAPTYCG